VSLQAGLSFEQAPPFSIPLRFFLTAPLFLLAAAGLAIFTPEALSSRWSPQALALTHALTLGFLAMVMIGALMQMLPVVAGAIMPIPRMVVRLTHLPLSIGTLTLMAGFLGAGVVAIETGAALLAAGFTVFLAAAAISLARAAGNITVTGIRLAIISLAVAAILGVTLAFARTGLRLPFELHAASAAHIAFGLLGWVLLLVIGVAYQVVPMFQITPPYPPKLARWLAGALFALLACHAAAPLLPKIFAFLIDAALAGGIVVFALATLQLQSKRRRKLPDVTLDFWRLGMASLIACAAVWLAAQLWPAWRGSQAYPLLLGMLFISGFAVSVVSGMLYKIVPFLAWFHLQAQLQAKAGTIPNMKQMIDERWMRMQFRLHLAACILLIAASFLPQRLHIPAGIALGLSSLLLWVNLLAAVRRYLFHGGRMS
jgi:hypothetical protein